MFAAAKITAETSLQCLLAALLQGELDVAETVKNLQLLARERAQDQEDYAKKAAKRRPR